jgi:2-polyprenyl-3-methyl-5-hydroxy-6-metoxy-1,4-benzoquinol methylase
MTGESSSTGSGSIEQVVKFYNRWAPTYDRPDFMLTHEKELTLSLCRPVKGLKVLEIGAGTGRITTTLLSEGANVTALEPTPKMQDELKNKTSEQIATGALTITSDSLQSYDPDQQFDLVLVAMVVDHIEDVSIVFSKAQEALSYHGRLVISCVNPYYQLIIRKKMVCQDQQRNGPVLEPCPESTIRAHCHNFGTLLDKATEHGFALRILREAVIDETIVVAFPELADQFGYAYIYSALFQRSTDANNVRER